MQSHVVHGRSVRAQFVCRKAVSARPAARVTLCLLSLSRHLYWHAQQGFCTSRSCYSSNSLQIPIFSQTKIDCFYDIMIPCGYHTNAPRWTDRLSWEQKRNSLFWRGSTTGGRRKHPPVSAVFVYQSHTLGQRGLQLISNSFRDSIWPSGPMRGNTMHRWGMQLMWPFRPRFSARTCVM